jgi:glutamine amidotransferase
MCRLFGFRSNESSTVHPELVTERNSLRAQSLEHKDGWGIAYWGAEEQPTVVRGLGPAHSDPEFERVSSMVTARAVLAHVRLASVGKVVTPNAHPFAHGRWTFAHNGTVRDFVRHREAIEAAIAPSFAQHIHGETDSERCFYLFLSFLADQPSPPTAAGVARALVRTVRTVASITDTPDAVPSSMNFLVSDGHLLVGTRRQRTLYYASRCRTESPGVDEPHGNGAALAQIMIASEELSLARRWCALGEDEVIAVDEELRLFRWRFDELT